MVKYGVRSFACLAFLLILLFFAAPARADYSWKIVGGTTAATGAWPSAAALIYDGYAPAQGQFCGGSLIDSRWVLTAAHCVSGLKASGVDVLLNQTDLAGSGGERLNVDMVIVHPDYNALTTDYDVALLRLASASTQAVTPIIAQGDPQGLAPVGATSSIIGWGATSAGGSSSNKLLQAEVQIVSQAQLEQDYDPAGFYISDNMLGAGVRGGGTDGCQGDSGGPLYVRDASGSGWTQAGITSFGEGCARPNLPGVYARLSVFSDWIANATNSSLAPTITISHPVDGASNVPLNTSLFVQFSTDMTESTITNSTFTLSDSLGSPVAGTVRYDADNHLAVFDPVANMAANSPYTANVTTGAASLLGTAMAANHAFSFRTGYNLDISGPSVVSVSPASGATGASQFEAASFVFDEYLDPFSVNASTVLYESGSYTTSFDALSRTGVVRPGAKFGFLTAQTAKATTQIRDMSGNTMDSESSTLFTVGASPNDLPTLISYVIPSNGTDNRTVATVVTATFLLAMDTTSLTSDTFYLENAVGKVAGAVTYDSGTKVATFTPTSNLDYATIYTATLAAGVRTLAGTTLGSPVIWNFTTGNAQGTDANSTTSTQVAATKGTGNIEVSLGTGSARLYGVNAISDTDTSLNTSGKPTDYAFPSGLVAYQIAVPVTNPGSSATVTLKFPDLTNGTRVYKVDSTGFSQFAGATITGANTVTMTVTDGGTGDTDGVINGVINDPVGLAQTSSTPTPAPSPSGGGGGGGGGGGCLLAPETGLGMEALLAMVLPLAAVAVRRAGRRRRNR